MSTIVDALTKTLELLITLVVSGAEAAYQKVKPRASLYFKSLLVTALVGLVLVPALALAKMVTGVAVFAYAAALLAIIFTLILGLLWSPLGVVMGMLTEDTLNPIVGGERFVRFVATILFVELLVSFYLIRIPMHQNLATLPLLIIVAASVGLGTFVWGGWLSGRFYTFVATVIMFLTTLSFFMPQTFAAIGSKVGTVDQELARATSAPWDKLEAFSQAQPATGSDHQIQKVQIYTDKDTDVFIPPGTNYKINAPGDITYTLPNGERITVRNGERIDIGKKLPPKFKIRGTPGIVDITTW